MKIGLLSDTHTFLDEQIFDYFSQVDEIWHAGDIGDLATADALEAFKPLRAVYGNIDGHELRARYPEDQVFVMDGVSVWMTHIGGYPPRYNSRIMPIIKQWNPKLFVCGHSHILKIMPDTKRPGSLYINPGAAGRHGFHIEKTIVRFELIAGRVEKLEVIKLGKRAKI
ncbi:MAG: metallophosphoesterase family protein [Cyclobacteriaceae bacterium]|nr:metallophosphoesterase family protein [Cyclobacteriaceae bacterium]